jgi:hypothetical protein
LPSRRFTLLLAFLSLSRENPLQKWYDPSAFSRNKDPVFIKKRVAVLFFRSTLGVWLPFQWFLVSIPCEAYLSFERSWAFPYSAFLLLGDRKKVPLLLSALALFYQTLLKPDTGASAASSHRKKPSSLYRSSDLHQSRRLMHSWVSTPSRYSLRRPSPKSISLFGLPSRP